MNAFSRPAIRQTAIAVMMPTNAFCECQTNMEMTTALASDATEPTDRSKPPTESEIVIPIAMTVTMEIERKMLMIFVGIRKLSDMIPNTAIRMRIVTIVPYLYRKSKKSKDLAAFT